MSDKFQTILAGDTFAPRLPTGSRLLFQRGRQAKPGDIVAVSYTDDINDFCIEPYREGVAYFAVATRAALPKRKHETPKNGGGEVSDLSDLAAVDFDDDTSTAATELIYSVSDLIRTAGDVLLEIETLKTTVGFIPESLEEAEPFAETLKLIASTGFVEAKCYKLINAVTAEAERNLRARD
ncbi:S24 family peptidase [Methylomonas sp. LL1]|uniref:S24 family peptidase n=1 Tax=Methylomonas sp. LL1 TaxID=2785785 RepID=UPI0018C35991|nr:S24 family peptidase [Methylomonas sp. LL1]QPK65432.1 S24 family peptidase [Methylomonas sp. LL1]